MSVPLQLAYTCSLATVSIAAAGRVEASRSAEACAKLRSALGAQSEINISVTSCAHLNFLMYPYKGYTVRSVGAVALRFRWLAVMPCMCVHAMQYVHDAQFAHES